MSKYARNALWIVAFLHCAFAIFIYGNQNIFYMGYHDVFSPVDSIDDKGYQNIIYI
jgi:hypothetical protein